MDTISDPIWTVVLDQATVAVVSLSSLQDKLSEQANYYSFSFLSFWTNYAENLEV